jgi:hypothetical protein
MVRLHYGESNVKLIYSNSLVLPNIGEKGWEPIQVEHLIVTLSSSILAQIG